MFLKTAMPASEPLPAPAAAGALPKVNVPPSAEAPQPAAANGHAASDAHVSFDTEKRGPFAWDFKFSLGLILLVVAVNMALALLLGKTGDLNHSAALQMLAKPQERNIPLQKSPAELETLAPAAGSPEGKSSTHTYISPEDQRLLLKYLETPAERRPVFSNPSSNR